MDHNVCVLKNPFLFWWWKSIVWSDFLQCDIARFHDQTIKLQEICFWCHNARYCVVEIRAWILEVACFEFSSKFTPLHLTIWTVCSKWEASPSMYWSLDKSPLFFLWRFGLSNFVSVVIREQKGLRKKDYLEKCPSPLNKFPRNWFLHDMISWVSSSLKQLAAYSSNGQM